MPKIKAPIADTLILEEERFHSGSTGLFAFLPIIRRYGIDKIIEESLYPETKSINRLSSILSFIVLKLTNVKRYSDDDLWCMDRGLGLFAGLNVSLVIWILRRSRIGAIVIIWKTTGVVKGIKQWLVCWLSWHKILIVGL